MRYLLAYVRGSLNNLISSELYMKRHIDCDWLIEKKDGVYLCCDTRSPHKGHELDDNFVYQEACEYFHPKKQNIDISYFNNLKSAVSEG